MRILVEIYKSAKKDHNQEFLVVKSMYIKRIEI